MQDTRQQLSASSDGNGSCLLGPLVHEASHCILVPVVGRRNPAQSWSPDRRCGRRRLTPRLSGPVAKEVISRSPKLAPISALSLSALADITWSMGDNPETKGTTSSRKGG